MLIVIDAGHDGKDPSTVVNGLLEKDLTLKLALKTGNYLSATYHCEIMYIRNKDIFLTLSERVNLVNKMKADGIADRGMKQKNFVVLSKTRMPALLTETLFLSNPQEAKLLKSDDFLNAVAKAHAVGLAKTAHLKARQKGK